MSYRKSKRILGMTYLQIGILVGGGILAFTIIGCLTIIFLFANRPATIPTTNLVSTPNSISTTIAMNVPVPAHRVGDYWDNGKGTNFAYFIIADKSITEDDAKAIIKHYQDEHKGYKLMNIYIFCDELYADYKYWDVMDYSGGLGDEIFKHVMYWLMSGEWTSSGGIFMTEPNRDYPTFGMDCK